MRAMLRYAYDTQKQMSIQLTKNIVETVYNILS